VALTETCRTWLRQLSTLLVSAKSDLRQKQKKKQLERCLALESTKDCAAEQKN
jgi:hypothetical protein